MPRAGGVPWGAIAVGAAGATALTVWLLARRGDGAATTAPRRSGRAEGETAAQAARRARLMPAFLAAAERHAVPLAWLLAIARKETGFANVRSAPGARDDELGGAWGPMQVTSATAKTLGFAPGAALEARGRAILSDPALGIELGARLLARLARELGRDLGRVAAAYNAGAGRVKSGQVPAKTRTQYVPPVLAFAAAYESAEARIA